MRNNRVVLILLCLSMLFSTVVHGKDGDGNFRLVFTTFDVSSAGSSGYLRDGVQSMLASRLATKDKVLIVDRSYTDKELLALKNKQASAGTSGDTSADYLVTGSLNGLKSGLNIQVVLYPFATDKEALRYEVVVKNLDNMLADIDKLANDIAQSAFTSPKDGGIGGKSGADTSGVSAFATSHPEAAYKKGLHSGGIAASTDSNIQVSAKDGKKTVRLNNDIRTLAVGDIDGDGLEEIIVLEGTTLEIYKSGDKKIEKMASMALPRAVACHAINVADLDGNGRAEIYISATDGLDIASLVVAQDNDQKFRIVSSNIPWYIRPVTVPGKGISLLGQRRGSEKTEMVKPGVHFLQIEAGKIVAQQGQLPLPAGVNLFDFVYADLDGDGAHEIVAIDKKERIKVFNHANELLWVSNKPYGGSLIYLGPSRAEAVSNRDIRNFTVDEDVARELIFVPGRLVVADIDNDGRQELIINENSSSSLSIFSRLRIYDNGVIVGLAWDGTALNETWRTGTFRGNIAGFGFSVRPQTAQADKVSVTTPKKTMASLCVGNLPNSGTLFGLLPGTAETQLTAYDVEFSFGKTK